MGRLEHVLTQRYTSWLDELQGYGYVPRRPPPPRLLPTQFSFRVQRQPSAGPPGVTISIAEQWITAPANRLPPGVPERGGFRPYAVSWHAQFAGHEAEDGELAERLDLDPKKIQRNPELLIHRHPLGRPNEVRLPVESLPEPSEWIEDVERLVYSRTGTESPMVEQVTDARKVNVVDRVDVVD